MTWRYNFCIAVYCSLDLQVRLWLACAGITCHGACHINQVGLVIQIDKGQSRVFSYTEICTDLLFSVTMKLPCTRVICESINVRAILFAAKYWRPKHPKEIDS
jgi:hypothetical protein